MRVLIVQLKRIGDVILTTPLLSALRDHVPGVHLTLALDASTAGLAPALDADRILIRGRDFWLPLATAHFDVTLDVTGNDRSALVTALSRAKRRVTWQRFAKKPLRGLIYTEFVDSSVRDRHTADHHTDFLRALHLTVENIPLALTLPDSAKQEAAAALTAGGISPPFAVVHAGTARPEKYWLPDRWAEVIAHLRAAHGLPVILTGSNDPAERAHLDAIQNALPAPCPDLAGKFSLLGTAAVIAKARLLCAVDSAPVHLADALGTPVVALFGPTNPYHWAPRRTTSLIVTPISGMAPMSDVSTTTVQNALDKLFRDH